MISIFLSSSVNLVSNALIWSVNLESRVLNLVSRALIWSVNLESRLLNLLSKSSLDILYSYRIPKPNTPRVAIVAVPLRHNSNICLFIYLSPFNTSIKSSAEVLIFNKFAVKQGYS